MAGVGRRTDVDDGTEVEGAAPGTQEARGEPAVPENGADVARGVHVYAGNAKVARLHPRQVVYEYLHDVTGGRPECRPTPGPGTPGPGACGSAPVRPRCTA